MIEKVRDVVVGNIEVPEAVKEICPTPRPSPPRDVVLHFARGKRGGRADLCIKPRRRDRRGCLDRGGQASQYNE